MQGGSPNLTLIQYFCSAPCSCVPSLLKTIFGMTVVHLTANLSKLKQNLPVTSNKSDRSRFQGCISSCALTTKTPYRPVQTTVGHSSFQTTSLGPPKFCWTELAGPVRWVWKPEGGGRARNTCCWQLAWKLRKCCNSAQQAASLVATLSCVAMLAATHSKKNIPPAPFSLSPTALNIILWLRLKLRELWLLFLTLSLTLSKSEPTFAVTSSTSVSVSMLTKTPPPKVWAAPRGHTSRPGRKDSEPGIKEALFCESTPRPSALGAPQHVSVHTPVLATRVRLMAGRR